MQAVAQVKQIITIQGVDNASATIAKAQSGLAKTAQSAEHVAEKAGDIERGVRGVKDILGQTASKELQDLSDKFGGIESILKGFGPKLGVVGLGLAAVAAGAAYLWQKAEEARKKQLEVAAELATTELDRAKNDQTALAARYGVSAELLGVEKQTDAAKRAQADAARIVNDLVEKERDLIKATKEERTADAEKLQGQILSAKELLRIQQSALEGAKRQAELAADQAAWAEASAYDADRALQLDIKGNQLLDKRDSLTFRTAANELRIRDATAVVAKLREKMYEVGGLEKYKAAVEKLLGLERNQRGLAAEGEALLNDRRAKGRAAADRAIAASAADTEARLRLLRAQTGEQAQQTERERIILIEAEASKERQAIEASKATAQTKAIQLQALDLETANKRKALAVELAAVDKAQADETIRLIEEQAKRAEAVTASLSQQRVRNTQAATASMGARLRELGDVDAAILAERGQAQADYAAEVIRINAEIAASAKGVNAESAEAAQLELLRQERTIEAKQRLAETERRLDAERSARTREGIASVADAVRGPAALLGQLGDGNGKLAAGLNTAAAAVGGVARSWKGLKASAPDAIGAAGAVAAAFVDGEREKAAVLAVSEAAQAVALAFTPGRQAEAAGHGAAAALYAGIAGGVIGGGGAAPAATGSAGSAGGFSSQPQGGTPISQQGQQTQAVVINFNQPLVTRQEIGKALNTSLKSIGATGYAKAKGV